MADPIQDVKFLPGIRQDVDELFAPPGTLIDAQNIRYSEANGISGRNGTKNIVTSAEPSNFSLTNPAGIGAIGTALGQGFVATTRATATTGAAIVTYDTTRSTFGLKGYHSRALPVRSRGGIDVNGVNRNFGSGRIAIAANSLGYLMYLGMNTNASTAGAVRYQIQDSAGGLVNADAVVPGGASVRGSCVALGTQFVLVYQSGTALNAINFDVPASGSITQSAPYSVGTLTASAAFWDICHDSTGTNWYLVFQNAAATIRADRFAVGATVSNANNTTACTGTVPVTAYHNATGLWIGYLNNPGVTGAVTYRVAQSDLSGFVAAAVVLDTSLLCTVPLIGPPHTTASSATATAAYRGTTGALNEPNTQIKGLTASAVVGVRQGLICGGHAISKPTSAGQIWVMTGGAFTNSKYQRAVLIALAAVGSGSGSLGFFPELATRETERAGDSYMAWTNTDMFATVAVLPTGNHAFLVPEVLQKSASSASPDAIRLSVFEYEALASYKSLISANGVVLSGQPVAAPGQGASMIVVSGGASEVGFVDRPYVVSSSQSGGGALTLLATYSFIFVLEWTDFNGQRHRSAPSAPLTVPLTGGNNQLLATICHLYASQKGTIITYGLVRIVAYRTLANQPDVYYRDSDPTAGSSITGTVVSNTVSCGLSADATVAQNERIYTDGGVRDNSLAPSCRYLCKSEERVWCGGLWDPRIVQASKIIVPGEPLQFTDDFAFQIVIPDEVTGLAYLDGSVIAFCQNAIYVVSGDGPNDQGAGSFTPPRALSRDLGCIDYRSIVETSLGVFFQSTRGIYLIPRGLGNPIFVGMPVQYIMSAQGSGFSRVLAAATSQDSLNRLVRFLVENPTNSTTRVLVYDLDQAQTDPLSGWSYDTFTSRLSCLGNWPDGVFLSLYTIGANIGYLDETTPTFLTDASNTQDITSAVETSDLRFAGLAGQWRCDTVIGLMSAPTTGATVTMTVSCDDLTPDTRSWAMTTATGAIYRQITPAQPQCTAVNVRLSSARTAVRGPNFHGVTVELQPQPGARRTNSSER